MIILSTLFQIEEPINVPESMEVQKNDVYYLISSSIYTSFINTYKCSTISVNMLHAFLYELLVYVSYSLGSTAVIIIITQELCYHEGLQSQTMVW